MNEMSEVRLIDATEADKILTELHTAIQETGNVYGISGTIVESVRPCVAAGVRAAKENLNRMPTIEAKPVRHGVWKYGHISDSGWSGYYCSVCGNEAYCDTDYGYQLFDFCQNCGADMREENVDNG